MSNRSTAAPAEITLRTISALTDIAREDWDACANPLPVEQPGDICRPMDNGLHAKAQDAATPPWGAGEEALETEYNPFITHDFLSALERSGSARTRTGWQPLHAVAEAADGTVLGVAPCYAKSHSQGEYVFDHSWADAYERAGGRYYPKLQVSVPFTPATGRRLLVRPGPHAQYVRGLLADGLAEVCRRSRASSVHVTFPTEAEWKLLGQHDYLLRTHRQFHWQNAGYESFDAFLGALASRKRKTIRRERSDALADGITIHWLSGSDLTEAVWDAFFEFYMDTGSRKWGHPYLTRAFYSMIGESMRDRILLVMAKRNRRWIAGAINFIGSRTLFGRHWGAIEHHPFLHFEVCYYQAIEYAIAHRLPRVEAGAQGKHKLARGYLPTETYSAHYIADPALRRAIADFLKAERDYIAEEIEEFADAAPFRKE
ncbi:MAG TPA: GNAT family N-acetyltransferase [Xanthobacteraceae bacterium]|nr:GNAT family N-acetyltransferase [Xanthobacteraceae bacterium]